MLVYWLFCSSFRKKGRQLTELNARADICQWSAGQRCYHDNALAANQQLIDTSYPPLVPIPQFVGALVCVACNKRMNAALFTMDYKARRRSEPDYGFGFFFFKTRHVLNAV
jgi:hypothetical protein